MRRPLSVALAALLGVSCGSENTIVLDPGRPALEPPALAPNEIFELRLASFGQSADQRLLYACELDVAWDSLPANGVTGRPRWAHASVSITDSTHQQRATRELDDLRLGITYLSPDSARIDIVGPLTLRLTASRSGTAGYQGSWACPAGFPGSDDRTLTSRGFRTSRASSGYFQMNLMPPPPPPPTP